MAERSLSLTPPLKKWPWLRLMPSVVSRRSIIHVTPQVRNQVELLERPSGASGQQGTRDCPSGIWLLGRGVGHCSREHGRSCSWWDGPCCSRVVCRQNASAENLGADSIRFGRCDPW